MSAPQRKRRRVEIYFVLYLVALVFLMPDRMDQQDANVDTQAIVNARLEFSPDRMRLTCSIERDSAGMMRIESLDSLNVIRYTGTVTDLEVSARIEEVETGQVLTVQPGSSPTPLFALEHEPQRSAVVFRWNPSVDQVAIRTYRVTISGSGVPVRSNGANSSDYDEIPTGLRMTGSTQFVLTTQVNNEQAPTIITIAGGRDTLVLRDTSQQSQFAQTLGEFWIEPARDVVTTVSQRTWTNRLSIGGADPSRDLVGLPLVRVVGEQIGDVQRSTDQRTILLSGRAPRTGSVTVEVRVTRRDGQTRTTSFVVTAHAMPAVNAPDIVFPGIDYQFDPRLPSIENVRAVIRDGDREIASTTESVIRFRVAARDTGRTFTFERFVDGVREGVPQPMLVRNFPAPIIRSVDRGSDARKKIIVVQFYAADRSSNRPRLRVLDGNAADVKRLAGNLRAASSERPTVSWLETFEITQRDASRPFTFRVQAFDDRGVSSAPWVEDN